MNRDLPNSARPVSQYPEYAAALAELKYLRWRRDRASLDQYAYWNADYEAQLGKVGRIERRIDAARAAR